MMLVLPPEIWSIVMTLRRKSVMETARRKKKPINDAVLNLVERYDNEDSNTDMWKWPLQITNGQWIRYRRKFHHVLVGPLIRDVMSVHHSTKQACHHVHEMLDITCAETYQQRDKDTLHVWYDKNAITTCEFCQ